jgi:hypothetical protein
LVVVVVVVELVDDVTSLVVGVAVVVLESVLVVVFCWADARLAINAAASEMTAMYSATTFAFFICVAFGC